MKCPNCGKDVKEGAKFCVGRRVYWNVAKIRKYLDEISE